MNIDIKKFSVKNLFEQDTTSSLLKKNEILKTPRYQRIYSWGETQWTTFFEDIQRSYRQVELDTDFWGSIILCKKNNVYEIVDGQQRIITLLILKFSLGHNFTNSAKLPLALSEDVQNNIFLKMAEVGKINRDQKRNNMYEAKEYFDKKLSSINEQEKQAIHNFVDKTIFSVVIVDDEIESNLLFGRLNTRGLKLSQVDLIKYWIFSKVDKQAGKQNNDIILEKWTSLQNLCSSIHIDIERFITLWWQSHYQISTNDSLYEEFKNRKDMNYIAFLDDILGTGNKLIELRNNNNGNDNHIGRNLKFFLKFSNDGAFIALIAIIDSVLTKKQKIELIEILTNFEFTTYLFTYHKEQNTRVKQSSDLDLDAITKNYIDFSESLKGGPLIAAIEQAIATFKNAIYNNMPASDDFQLLFTNLRHCEIESPILKTEKLLSTYAVYTLANWQDNLNRGTGVVVGRTDDDDEYSIEHIVPKAQASEKEKSVEYKIGNLMVLEKRINNNLGDEPLSKKINSYKKSSYPQVQQFLYKSKRKTKQWGGSSTWTAKDFDKQNISLRGEAMAQEFYNHLSGILQ